MVDKKINELRKKNNMSQEELASKLFVSSRAIIKWESGETEPSITNLNAIAEIFGVTTDYLLDRDEISLKNDRKYSNLSIVLSVIFVLFVLGIIVGLVFSTIALINEIKVVADAVASNNNAAASAPVGLHFASSEFTDKTIEFAASQGVTTSPESSDFTMWMTILLARYTLRNGEYWYNLYTFINYGPMIWLIILEMFLFYSLTITIIHFIQNLKLKLFDKKILNTILSFTSLNLPVGFILFVRNLALEKRNKK